ncbi:MAG TPA: hypothetical protein VF066_03260 [Thermoleophilaceae bacterium]
MDPAALTAFLAPALGFLLRAGGKLAEQASEALGDGAWEQAKKLWSKLSGKVEGDETAKQAAERLAETPEDEAARGALTFRLQRILADDPALAAALAKDWEEARAQTTAIASAERAVALAGQNVGNVIITGDRGEPPPR